MGRLTPTRRAKLAKDEISYTGDIVGMPRHDIRTSYIIAGYTDYKRSATIDVALLYLLHDVACQQNAV